MPAASSGGVTPLSVQIKITTTGVSAAARGMGAVGKAGGSMSRSLAASSISTRTLGDAMRMTATLMKYTVVGAFMNAGKQAIQMQRQFEVAFSRIKGLVVVGGDSVDKMREKVLSLAGETTRAPLELADALYYITSAGIKDASTAMEVLESSAKAAAAGLGTTNTVADAITSTLNAYGQENYSAAKATDILVATVREGKAEADTFAPALGKVLPVAAAYGASFEDVSAAIAALSRGGLSAGTAAIYVRQTLSQLLKPSKQAQEVLAGVGTNADEIRKNIQEKGLFPALMELRDQLGGIENAADFTKVFGNVRALTAVLSLVGPAAEDNAKIFERMQSATGDLDYAFAAYADTTDAQFNKAMAEQQAALIKLGEALKPVITTLLKLGTAISKTLGAFVGTGFGKGFARVAAGAVLAIAALSTVMKTMSALIRLGSNLNITLFGTQFRYNATTGAITKYTTGTITAATATGTMTRSVGAWTVANGFLAGSIRLVALSMNFLTKSMTYIIPVLTIGLMLFEGFKFIAGMFNRGKDGADSLGQSVGKLNTLLDETVKYGRSNLVFDVTINTDNANSMEAIKRLRDEIEEQSPNLLPDFKNLVTKQGAEAGALYIQSMLDTAFAGNTKEFKDTFVQMMLSVRPDVAAAFKELGSSVDYDEAFGDPVTNAETFQALASAVASGGDVISRASIKAGDGLESFIKKVTDTEMDQHAERSKEALGAYGQAFTDTIQNTGQLNPLVANIKKWQAYFESAGTNSTEQAEIISQIVGPALTGLTGDLDLVADSTGNFRNVFLKTANETAAIKFIENTFGVEGARALEILEVLRDRMRAIPEGAEGAAQSAQVLVDALGEMKVKAEDVVYSVYDLDTAVTALGDRFSEGLHPEVQGLVDDFDAAQAALKNFQRGQEALMGVTRGMTEAQIDFRDSMRGFREDAAAAGGDLFSGSANADKAQEGLLDAMDSVLEVVNQFALKGDEAGATRALGEGIARIVGDGMAAGLNEEDINKFLEMHSFGPEMINTLLGAKDAQSANAQKIGNDLMSGFATGIENGRPYVSQAIDAVGDDVIARLKRRLGIKSPSTVMAKEVGKPSAEGVAVGFKAEMAGSAGRVIEKSMENAIMNAYKKGGYRGAGSFFKKFLEQKEDVETPATDYVKAVMGRMKDIIGSLSGYIKSQLNFRKAQADLAKLINMQKGLDDRRKRAAREQQYAQTRFGMGGGAEVTGYEQAQLDELQLEFERVSRDYAMGRATYVQLVDAEIALFEARAAASEINDTVIDSQNKFIDASVDVENKQLNLADATVNVLSAYQGVQEAAAELYKNHKELETVYNNLATATGIASGKLQIGTTDLTTLGGEVGKYGGYVSTVGGYVSTLGNNVTVTGQAFNTTLYGENGVFANIIKAGGNVKTLTAGIGADFTNLARGLLDTDSQMYKDLKSLGPAIFKAIQSSANESFAKSPLVLKIPVSAIIDTGGGGGYKEPDDKSGAGLGTKPMTYSQWLASSKTSIENAAWASFGSQYGGGGQAVRSQLIDSGAFDRRYQSLLTSEWDKYLQGFKAVGGPVTGNMPYVVGERGPEMFVPKVSGTIVTNSALDRYARNTQRQTATSQASSGHPIIVTVNNPVPAAAEDSITRRMKVLANSGLFG